MFPIKKKKAQHPVSYQWAEMVLWGPDMLLFRSAPINSLKSDTDKKDLLFSFKKKKFKGVD